MVWHADGVRGGQARQKRCGTIPGVTSEARSRPSQQLKGTNGPSGRTPMPAAQLWLGSNAGGGARAQTERSHYSGRITHLHSLNASCR